MQVLRKVVGRLLCVIGEHDWTSLAMEGRGVPRHLHPEPRDGIDEILRKFREYATMYCRRCGTPSRFTL
jgi:hypothetical protein